jgi:LmbE family N-acetylglucosaminyl deacetylase
MVKQSGSETAVVFCAHPDDEALGVGGTIAKYIQMGKQVIVVIFTDGESSHPWEKKEFVTKKRRDEVHNAASFIGSPKIIHLGLKDGSLTKDIKKPIVHQLIKDILVQYKPSKVFTHARDDMLYPDHVAVHKVTLGAIDDYNKTATSPTEVFTFNIWGFAIWNRERPLLIVDITTTFEQKIKALRAFDSQKLALAQLWPSVFIKALIWGFRANTRYAESFYKIR